MKMDKIVAFLAGVVVLFAGLQAARAVTESFVSGQEAASTVSVRDLQLQNGTVAGVLVNNSPRLVRHLRLLVRVPWLWNDERHPGDYSPGRADFYSVDQDVPPGRSVPFTVQLSPPLAERSDGRYEAPIVQVVGFTEVGE